MAHSEDLYGTQGGTPDVNVPVQGEGLETRTNVQANGNDFGAQVGEAQQAKGEAYQRAGVQMADTATQFAAMATEAKANEAITTQWAPQAADLRAKFDQLSPQDKIGGYNDYVASLQKNGTQFVDNSASPYERQIKSQWVARHISNEIDGARRDQVQAVIQFSGESNGKLLELQQGDAIKNYQNPERVSQTVDQMNGVVLKQAIDQGADPNKPEDMAKITDQQNAIHGETAVGMIHQAVADGNLVDGYEIYNQNKNIIPGYRQATIEDTLHVAATAQNAKNNGTAILAGTNIPEQIGAPPLAVQSTVARVAESTGENPNNLLTVARIESSYGQNLGKRGDIGQTGKGGTIEEQAHNMAAEWKKAGVNAQDALGRDPAPWEQYACYQQGAGGGPALLKSMNQSPNARAIDVLTPLYGSQVKAASAIKNNGGNVSMTSSQFLDMVKQKWTDNSLRAACEVPKPVTGMSAGTPAPGGDDSQPAATKPLSQALVDQHQITGPAVQQGGTPMQQKFNYDQVYSGAVERAWQIPNIQTRDATLKYLNEHKAVIDRSAAAYSEVLTNGAQKLAQDPKFTSVDQMPPEMQSAVMSDKPLLMNYMQEKANQNAEKASGGTTKDMKEYGNSMFDLMRGIHDGTITSSDQLLDHLPNSKTGKPGDITIAGYEKLQEELKKNDSPESAAEGKIKTEAFSAVKAQVMSDMYGMKDLEGQKLWAKAIPKLFKAWEDGMHDNVPIGELTDPDSPKYFGKAVSPLIRSNVQKAIDMKNVRPLRDLVVQYKLATDPVAKKFLLHQMSENYGVIDDVSAQETQESNNPKAPISQ